jgi:hypothetical protein
MMEEDREVLAQTRREMETKKASSSTAQALTIGQGGTKTKQNQLFRNTNATVDEETEINYWYARPKGYLKDQAEARGWRLEGAFYTQRSGERVTYKHMTKLDWRRELFIILNIDDPLDP